MNLGAFFMGGRGHLRINVRSSSIEAVKFTDVQPGRKQLDFAFDLGAN